MVPPASTRAFTAQMMADDLAAVLDHAGWDRALIAGASMGGNVALAFAARHRATAGLLAIDTTAWYGPTAPSDWARRADIARQGGMAALLEFQRARWLSDEFAAHPGAGSAGGDLPAQRCGEHMRLPLLCWARWTRGKRSAASARPGAEALRTFDALS